MASKDGELNWGGLLTGLVVLGLGVLFLLREFGVTKWSFLVHGWWALLVVVLGLAKLLSARGAKKVGEGVTLTLLGVWLFVVHTGQYGLTYGNSWPLVLVAVGAGMMARAIARHWIPDRASFRPREGHHA